MKIRSMPIKTMGQLSWARCDATQELQTLGYDQETIEYILDEVAERLSLMFTFSDYIDTVWEVVKNLNEVGNL